VDVTVNSNLYVNRHSLDKTIYTIAGCIYPEPDVDTQAIKTLAIKQTNITKKANEKTATALHPTECLVHPTKHCSCGNVTIRTDDMQVRNTAAVQKNVSAAG